MPLLLSHTLVAHPEADRAAFVLHGMLGSANNWRGFARALTAQAPRWKLILVDLRNHGESHPAPPPHTLSACAADLSRLAEHLGVWPEAVIGHSYGGKVALAYAEEDARPPAQLWVLDSPPCAWPADHSDNSEVGRVIAALRQIPLPLARRDALPPLLAAMGFSDAIGQWMTTNLRAGEGGLVWRFELDAIEPMLEDYFVRDFHPFLKNPYRETQVKLVRGERSDRWSEAELAWLQAHADSPGLQVYTLPQAGHWLHTDNPAGLLAMMLEHGMGGSR